MSTDHAEDVIAALREQLSHATEFTYGPKDDPINGGYLTVTAQWRGDDRWAVVRNRECLNRDGEWEWEIRPSERDDDFLTRCRFSRDEALRLAQRAAVKILADHQEWLAKSKPPTP